MTLRSFCSAMNNNYHRAVLNALWITVISISGFYNVDEKIEVTDELNNNNNINLPLIYIHIKTRFKMLVTFKNCFNFIETMNNNYHHALLNAMDNADTNIMFSTWVYPCQQKMDENWLQELSLLVLSEGAVYDPPPV